MGFRSQDFIDVAPASTSKREGLRQLMARLAEPPAGETDRAAGEGASRETPVGSSAGFGVGPWTTGPVETWSIGDPWNGISMHVATDHSYALPWSPPEVMTQHDDTVSSLADLIDSLMGRPVL